MRGGSQTGQPTSNPKGLGRHLVIDLSGCRSEDLRDADSLIELLIEAAHRSGASIVGSYAERFGGGGGVSAIVVVKESHISIHTWPELGYASLDIFTCGQGVDPWKAYEVVLERLKPAGVGAIEIIRGLGVVMGRGNTNIEIEARQAQRGG